MNLFETGTYLRKPGGNVEVPVEQKAAGMKWALLNIGGDVGRDPTVWDYQRQLYRQHSLPHGPWMHCRSLEDVNFLLTVAKGWDSPLVGCNVEDVVADNLSLEAVGRVLRASGLPVHMATLPWVQNGQGWGHVDFCTLALEMFPLEGKGQMYLDQWQACVDHAFSEGAKKVTLLFSTTSPRSVYPNVSHCLFTADNVERWADWHDTVPQPIPVPPAPPPEVPKMLTIKQFPYTGPLAAGVVNRPSVQGLKRGMIRGGYLDQKIGDETDDFGPALEKAFKQLQRDKQIKPASGKYGRATWTVMRGLRVPAEMPNQGQWAMDAKATALVREDALTKCYPHPLGSLSQIGQGLHETDGLYGNWAMDFMAPGGTKVLAVERATIRKLSGRDPSQGWYGPGIFGFSIHYETPNGYRYFSTHYGARNVRLGQVVEIGQVIGTVGAWPGDSSRSHTHLGVTSPLGETDAKKRITEVSQAPHLAA